MGLEASKRIVEIEQLHRNLVDAQRGQAQVQRAATITTLCGATRPSTIDEDSTHRLGGGREEMPLAVPALNTLLTRAEHAQVGLVHQRRCRQRVVRAFTGDAMPSESSQLIVDLRQEFRRRGIACLFACRAGRFVAYCPIVKPRPCSAVEGRPSGRGR